MERGVKGNKIEQLPKASQQIHGLQMHVTSCEGTASIVLYECVIHNII